MYTFTPLRVDDYYLLYNWLNVPHVIDYWSHQKVNIEGIIEKYGLWLSGEVAKTGLIIHQNDQAIGLLSYFKVGDFEDFAFEVGHEDALGIEVLIGDEGACYKGALTGVLNAFYHTLDPHVKEVIAALAPDNTPAIKAFSKNGFVFEKDVFNTMTRNMEHIYVKELV